MTNKLIIYTCASVVFSYFGIVGAMDTTEKSTLSIDTRTNVITTKADLSQEQLKELSPEMKLAVLKSPYVIGFTSNPNVKNTTAAAMLRKCSDSELRARMYELGYLDEQGLNLSEIDRISSEKRSELIYWIIRIIRKNVGQGVFPDAVLPGFIELVKKENLVDEGFLESALKAAEENSRLKLSVYDNIAKKAFDKIRERYICKDDNEYQPLATIE